MNLRPFQILMLGIFGFMMLAALVLLSNYESKSSIESRQYGNQVIIWGTFDRRIVEDYLRSQSDTNESLRVVQYVEVDPREFDFQLINAIAEGEQPDMVLIGADKIVKHRTKLQVIPYENYPVRDYFDAFIDPTEIFMLNDGIYALPLMLDPMVLFWNRDLFATSGLVQPPQTWEAIVSTMVPTLTRRDSRRTILQSAIAFGEYRNVNHAKGILLTLLLQSGSGLISETDGRYQVRINDSIAQGRSLPLTTSLQFFTDFSNANSPLYSWNRSLPLDLNAFIAGDVATYFAFASEAEDIGNKNPNLNYDVAVMPQGAGATVRRTYANVYGLAILKSSRNMQGAYLVAQYLTGSSAARDIADRLNMVPVRRALLSPTGLDRFQRVSYESAPFARSWLDPDATASDEIFSNMVEDVVSSRRRAGEAANDAVNRLRLSF